MVNNLNSLSVITIYGQKYSVVKLVPLRIAVTSLATETGVLRYVIVPAVDIGVSTNTKNYLMSYALINPEFWIDRGAVYTLDEVDFGFNIHEMNVAEDFTVSPIGITVVSTYFGKDLILADELIGFPEINYNTPLMWTYWDTPQSNPGLVFRSTNRNAVTNFTVYFTATLVKLHIIPDDLIAPV